MSRSSGPPRALGVGERRARFPSPLVIRELSLNPRALRAPTPAAPDSTATAAGAPSADDAPRIRRSRRRAVLPTGRTGRRFAGGACDRLLPALAGGAPDAGGVAVGRAARTACSSSGRTRRPSRTPRGHPSHRIRCTSRPRLRRQCMSQRRRRSTDGDVRLDGASLDAGLHRREAAARVVREAVLGATGGDVVADGVGESERERAVRSIDVLHDAPAGGRAGQETGGRGGEDEASGEGKATAHGCEDGRASAHVDGEGACHPNG